MIHYYSLKTEMSSTKLYLPTENQTFNHGVTCKALDFFFFSHTLLLMHCPCLGNWQRIPYRCNDLICQLLVCMRMYMCKVTLLLVN